MQQQSFFDEIHKHKAFCFLLGNGINYQLHSTISWEELLYRLAEEVQDEVRRNFLIERDNSDQKSDFNMIISNPEFFSLLEIAYMEKKEKKGSLRKKVAEVLDQKKNNLLLEYAKRNNSQILTTNFDFNIEKTLQCQQSRKGIFYSNHWSDLNKTSTKYRVSEFFALEKKTSPEKQCAVWHIHGHIQAPGSIMLSQIDYVNAISYFKTKLFISNIKDEKDKYRNPVLSEDDWIARKSWLYYFFNCPLIIAGCKLNTNETFLRWLLLYRYQALQKIRRTLPSYYLTEENDDKKMLFWENIGFEVIRFKNYNQIYFDNRWEKAK